MQLFILRHGDAEPSAINDAARKLTEKGHEQAERVASFLEKHATKPGLILTSPYRRADQTARAVAERLKVELVTAEWLASGMIPSTAWTEIHAYRQFPSVMLVGHEPDLSGLIAFLLGLPSPTQLNVRKASLTALALPIWVDAMNAAPARKYPAVAFKSAVGLQRILLCSSTNKLATSGCEHADTAYSVEIPTAMIPEETCNVHRGSSVAGSATSPDQPGRKAPKDGLLRSFKRFFSGDK